VEQQEADWTPRSARLDGFHARAEAAERAEEAAAREEADGQPPRPQYNTASSCLTPRAHAVATQRRELAQLVDTVEQQEADWTPRSARLDGFHARAEAAERAEEAAAREEADGQPSRPQRMPVSRRLPLPAIIAAKRKQAARLRGCASSQAAGLRAATQNEARPIRGIETLVAIKLKRGPRGLGIDLDQENNITRIVSGSPAEQQGLLVGDMVCAVDGTTLAGRHVTQVLDFTKDEYDLRVQRVRRTDDELEMLTRGVLDTMQLKMRSSMTVKLDDDSELSADLSSVRESSEQSMRESSGKSGRPLRYKSFRGRLLEDGRPVHLVELQAWSVSEVDATLQKAVLGHSSRRAPPPQGGPASALDPLFDEIDASVSAATRVSQTPQRHTSPRRTSPPSGRRSAARARAAELDGTPLAVSQKAASPREPCLAPGLASAARELPPPPVFASASPCQPSPYRPHDASAFGQVELIKQIGQGTYGAVWSGMCAGKLVAVKLLPLLPPPSGAGNAGCEANEHAAEVTAEIRILQRCSCKYIVGYHDAFEREYNGVLALWVVMEYCELGSVCDLMRRSAAPLSEPQVACVCSSVLKALHFMHLELKVIHRDVKAANVLLTGAGGVRLGDLGVAAQMHSTMSKRGTMVGTPHWMAPEALTGVAAKSSSAYNFKVDIWGVGITAIECAQMAPPYAEVKELFKVIMQVVTGPPPKLLNESAASADFRAFLRAALIKDPTARPSAAQLAQHSFVASAAANALNGLACEQATLLRTQPESFFAEEGSEDGNTYQLQKARLDFPQLAARYGLTASGTSTLAV